MVQSSDPETVQITESNIKCIFAQVLAAGIGTLLTLNVNMMSTMITIVNGALKLESTSEGNDALNASNTIHIHQGDFILDDSQASLYGTAPLVSNLLASVFAGVFSDNLGRKKTLLISFLPHILSWVLLYSSKTALMLYLHGVAVGLGTAFSEYVVITYISEVASPEYRGCLFSVGKFGYGIGSFLTFLLGNFFHWRKLTLILLPVPWILPFYMLWLPESPLWLLNKGREKECRQSLMWLRGWTSSEEIEAEFQTLKMQINQKNEGDTVEQNKNATTLLNLLTKPEFILPFKISMFLFFSSFLLSLRPARFYFINTLNNLGVDAGKMALMTVTGLAGIIGCICLGLTIRKIGKRSLTLWTFSATAVCLLLMGLYSDLHTRYCIKAVWIVYVLCAIIYCFGGYTLGGMPWFISSEIFPQRYRGYCTSLTGVCAHIMIATLSQTYLDIEKAITVTNVLYAYGGISLLCCYYLYRNLPETENKSLHEMEEYFKNKIKKYDENVVERDRPSIYRNISIMK